MLLKYFRKIHRKIYVPESLFLNKVSGLRPAILLKKRQEDTCESCEIFNNIFFIEHLRATVSFLTKLQVDGSFHPFDRAL